MKKRTVKDFIALYAQEDEEKLVLIQDGVSADKTFLDTYWAAHTHALAMADVQTGQAISGRCCLSWPLTDKERDAGDYSKRFTKGQIYRIKARGWKGDALYEPQWYVTEVLEEGVPCPALEEIWAEYTKPILLEDEVLGTLTLDREMSIFEGTCKWMGKEVRISLDVGLEKQYGAEAVNPVFQIRKNGKAVQEVSAKISEQVPSNNPPEDYYAPDTAENKLEIPCQPSDTVEIHLLCRDSFGLAYDFTTYSYEIGEDGIIEQQVWPVTDYNVEVSWD